MSERPTGIFFLLAVALCSCGREGATPNTEPDASSTETVDSDSGVMDFVDAEAFFSDQLPEWKMDWITHSRQLSVDYAYVYLNNLVYNGGRISASGFYNGGIAFAAEAPGATEEFANGENGWVTQYDLTGRLQWLRRVGANNQDSPMTQGLALGKDVDGGVLFAGIYEPWRTEFNSGLPDEQSLECKGPECLSSPGFFVRYESNGEIGFVGQVEVGPANGMEGGLFPIYEINRLSDDTLALSGAYKGLLKYTDSTGQPAATISNPDIGEDAVVVLLSSNLQIKNVIALGTNHDDYIMDLAPNPDGTFYLLGGYMGPVTFAPGEENEEIVIPQGRIGTYLAKYENSGRLLWVHNVDYNALGLNGGSITVASNGDVLLYETVYEVELPVGDSENESVMTAEGDRYGLLHMARFDANGNRLWSRSHRLSGSVVDCAELQNGKFACVCVAYGDVVFNMEQDDEFTAHNLSEFEEAGVLVFFDGDGRAEEALVTTSPSGVEFTQVESKPADELGPETVYVAGVFSDAVRFGTGGGDQVVVDVGPGDTFGWFNSQMFIFALVREEQE